MLAWIAMATCLGTNMARDQNIIAPRKTNLSIYLLIHFDSRFLRWTGAKIIWNNNVLFMWIEGCSVRVGKKGME